jgi:hypothetical protein
MTQEQEHGFCCIYCKNVLVQPTPYTPIFYCNTCKFNPTFTLSTLFIINSDRQVSKISSVFFTIGDYHISIDLVNDTLNIYDCNYVSFIKTNYHNQINPDNIEDTLDRHLKLQAFS